MKECSFLRELLELAGIYVVGAVVGFSWFVYGLFIYFQPMPLNSKLGADFSRDIGTSLIGHGLIFMVSFIVGGALSSVVGKRQREEARKDRQMIREIHQWMQETKTKSALSENNNAVSHLNNLDTDTNIIPSDLPIWDGNGVEPKEETVNLN